MAVMKIFLLVFCLHLVAGEYVITLPLKWASGQTSQVCLSVPHREPEDHLSLQIFTADYSASRPTRWDPNPAPRVMHEVPLVDQMELQFDPVKQHSCVDVQLPSTMKEHGEVIFSGIIQGKPFADSRSISIAVASSMIKTFVQTDKYLYKPGQKVQFRILTLNGPLFKVSTMPYSEIYIESPSYSRIAQWLNVSNTAGLLHKEFQLLDEPEEGNYAIKVRGGELDGLVTQVFRVEDYVLPRFELAITSPKFIVADDEMLSYRVCADYTFGQPLRGNLTGTISNGGWGNYKIEKEINEEIFGCKDLKVNATDLKINHPDYYVYRVHLSLTVEEQGTGSKTGASSSTPITRTMLHLVDQKLVNYRKPEIPYVTSIKASFPDESPAAQEPFSVCAGDVCRNLTSDDNGILKFSVPPHIPDKQVTAKALNYPDRELSDEDIMLVSGSPFIGNRFYNRKFMYGSSVSTYFKNYFTPSNSSLQLLPQTTDSVTCNPGGPVSLQLSLLYSAFDLTNADLNIQIVSRAQIQFSDMIPIAFTKTPMPESMNLIGAMETPGNDSIVRGVMTLNVDLPPTMSPEAKVLVWYTRPDGEVVPDSRAITMTKCLPHNVAMTWPVAKAEQGTTLPLTVTAEPNSLCSMGIVDKSVELLAKDKDSLTVDTVFDVLRWLTSPKWITSQINDAVYCKGKIPEKDEVSTTTPAPSLPRLLGPEPFFLNRKKRSLGGYHHSPFESEFADAVKIFEDNELFIISDLTYETRPCRERPAPPPVPSIGVGPSGGFGGGGPEIFHSAVPTPVAGSAGPGQNDESETSRTYFPETWLWKIFELPSDGVFSEELTLPDTITEWVGKAVCVHPTAGVGISAPTAITSFTPFFIDLTMPPSIKKGEVMPLTISVFNYLETNLPVTVTLSPSPEYQVMTEGKSPLPAEDQVAASTFSLCVPKGEKSTVDLRIQPQAVGDVDLTVRAFVDESATECETTGPLPAKSDTVVKPIRVDFEGFIEEKTHTKYICSEDILENEDHVVDWRLEAPMNIVPDSARGWVTVAGDLLGPTLENLGGLIRMPTGCGEQNMLNFAPNIYVLHYLEGSGQINEPTREKLLSFMRTGYQRELKYKHSNGAYSAFGERDASGSTWLTAFVVKSYAQSRPYIQVDDTEVGMSSAWLKSTQLENGCFESRGKVLHKGMKGGISDSKPKLLTAFVMAALLDAGEDLSSEAITNAAFCLKAEGNFGSDPYEKALVAHAFALAKHPDTASVIADLLGSATNSIAGMYWEMPTSDGKKATSTPAVAVETAGYVLMAMMESDPDRYMSHGHLIVKWISEQRNSQGGFISTQDTVIALQAMAIYESYQSQEPMSMTVDVKAMDFQATFQVEEHSKLLNQRADLPTLPTNLLASASGSGCFLLQGNVRYNVFDGPSSDAFTIGVSISEARGKCKAKNVKVCSSYLLKDGKSNMAVVEVGLISGYIPDKESLKRAVGYGTGLVKRYEVDGAKVLFYIDEFTKEESCVQFQAIREMEVPDAKPGTVTIYDYYEPEYMVSTNYKFGPHVCLPAAIPEGILNDMPAEESNPAKIPYRPQIITDSHVGPVHIVDQPYEPLY